MQWFGAEAQGFLWIDKAEGSEDRELAQAWAREKSISLEALPPHLELGLGVSGAQAFPQSTAAAALLKENLAQGRIKRRFWFLTDRQSPVDETKTQDPETDLGLSRIKRSPFFELWEGESSQLSTSGIASRLAALNLNILGDRENGGTDFPRLCLHITQLEIPGCKAWNSAAPRLFERLGLLRNRECSQILTAIDRRQRQFAFLTPQNREQSLRLIHFEVEGIEMDFLGPELWVSWFREQDPTPRELEMWAVIGRVLGRRLLIQKRWNREKHQQSAPKWMSEGFPETWQAMEGPLRFEFRRDSGESHGLFLDQRLNRRRLAEMAPGKSVLNLFAYTGGFGLMAAAKGSGPVTTVDLSAHTIEWAKRNFELNDLHDSQHEFFAADSFFFLDRAQKRGRRWQIIVCDPPIFSRSKERLFRIDKDYVELLNACRAVLEPGGTIFFSTHYEQWSSTHLEKLLRKNFPEAQISSGQVDRDFPTGASPLKSFFLRF